MITTLTNVGNSLGIILDLATLGLAHLKVGDEFKVVVDLGGTITLTPIPSRSGPEEVLTVIQDTLADYSRTMKNLA